MRPTRIRSGRLALMAFSFLCTAFSQSFPYSRRVWQSADGLPEDFAQSLAQTPDGYLWIGTSGGLVRFDGVRFTVFNKSNTPGMDSNRSPQSAR